jgi:uncharacterized repeat protein (TIGR01451 family)
MLFIAVLLVCGGIGATPSMAATAGPHWSIVAESEPTYFKAGDESDAYVITVRNDGGEPTTQGDAVIITDALPEGITATNVTAEGDDNNVREYQTMTCTAAPAEATVKCEYEEAPERGPVLAGATIVMRITVSIPEGVETLGANSVTVSGGGAPSASTSETTELSPDPAPFGVSFFDFDVANEAGWSDEQADSHPFEITANLAFNVSARESLGGEAPLANAAPKDLEVALPPGLVANPNVVPRCSEKAFLEGKDSDCPLDTQVGTAKTFFYGPTSPGVSPLYNVAPPPGQPAELGFSVLGLGHVPLFFKVHDSGEKAPGGEQPPGSGGYSLAAVASNVPEVGPLQGAILTLWGVPADANHDLEREGAFGEAGEECHPSISFPGGVETQNGCPSGLTPRPFLTLPSQCETMGLNAVVKADSWQNPAPAFPPFSLEVKAAEAITGCEQLSFAPSLTLVPENTEAGAPSGYTAELHMPQNEDPSALATPDLHSASVTLPAGTVLSPSVANGLQGCSDAQFASTSETTATCPVRSQIGTATISTPLLSSPMEGQIFLGEPECAPCTPADAQDGKLIRLFLQAQGSGLTIKLEGSASIDQSTGQVTATFPESPQLPFEVVKLTFDGGSNAPLANPSTCGTPLTATAKLTPYSSETPAEPSSEPFEVSGCPPPQFRPTLLAGTTDNQAGGFSPLTLTLSRTDQDEDLEGVTVHLPPGLLGDLSKVALCARAQAQAGTCGSQSEIGTVTVGAGPGSTPLFLSGHVYLTGPYEDAPFGLSIVVPAVAGPFDLGTIVVGARIEVSPSTAALTIVTGPLPQRLDGIPLQLKTANLDIDREGLVFNPTSCEPLAIEGTLTSSLGAAAAVSSRFQAANCAMLAFKPKLTALTHATAGKASGVHLHVRIAASPGEANIAKLKLDLPARLVPRLSTLQKSCPAAVFDASPSSCPSASMVGTATVLTPVLGRPLGGQVYVVSHGRTELPEIALVLQGEGVVIDVIGHTSVKGGITSSAFRSLPDVPFSELDLVLDAGPHSLLGANLPATAHSSLCGQRLAMPTEITGQNGAVLKQTTAVAVSGCPGRAPRANAKRKASGKA